jgi:hypothetical protein
MSLDNPVSHLKIHGFGAFQQCAEFFLYDYRNLLGKNQHPLREDEQEFLQNMRVMFSLFEITYTQKAELSNTLVLEKEAWQLLRARIGQWIEKYSALLERSNVDLDERRTFVAELRQLMDQWGIISSSFKQKLEVTPIDDKNIRELIEGLRAEITGVVTEA